MSYLKRRLATTTHMLLAFSGLALAPANAQSSRPNIVLIFCDDGGYADFGFMNQFTSQTTKFKTPNLDQLAQQSVIFTNGYVNGPLCSFSRSGLLTGRYSQRFGSESNYADTNNVVDGLPPNQVLMSERLKELGYATGAVGKWHLGRTEAQHPLSNGFDEFYGFLQGSREYFKAAGEPTNPGDPNTSAQGSVVADLANTPLNWADQPSFNNIPNDPTHGRMLTDAFGDEASRFIANHAGGADPFFLYVPFNAPHYPINKGKASDANEFVTSGMTPERRAIATLTYGLDRNVGQILDRLSDPNRDGDQSDSIRDNTIVVFVNDNGGSEPLQPGNRATYDNGPLRDYKGSVFEGGIRVPFLISAPGIAPGVVNDMVSSLDLFPTFVAAAGGAQTTPTDGVDLHPLLTGQQTGPVHEALFWRMEVDGFAVRKGDWKLAKGRSNSAVELYRLNPDGSGEDVDLSAQNPEKLRELIRDYVHWEATVDKIRNTGYSPVPFILNQFDEFRQRNDLTTVFNWKWTNGWRNDAAPATFGTLQRWDGAPNTVLIFETRNDASYTSTNNLIRAAGSITAPNPEGMYEFMLNEVRLQGNFGGAADRSGTINGNPLMFVNSLTGRQAQLSLNANRAGTGQKFGFNVNMDVVLVDNLLVTGDGTGDFTIGGVIRDFDGPRSIIKEGTSKLRLTGHNLYKGQTIVRGGELILDAAAAAVDGSQQVVVEAGGVLTLSNGSVTTDQLSVMPGGIFQFTGGTLRSADVIGNLTNAGGAFAPNATHGVVSLMGNYVQSAGSLQIDIGLAAGGGLQSQQLDVSGSAQLAGALAVAISEPVNFAIGDAISIIAADGGITGQFAAVTAPQLPAGLGWALEYATNSATLKVVNLPASGGPSDFYTRWRQAFGVTAGGDWDIDGDSDGMDFLAWQRSGFYEGAGPAVGVPEPASIMLSAGIVLLELAGCRRARRRPLETLASQRS